jgi:hypothetical protein
LFFGIAGITIVVAIAKVLLPSKSGVSPAQLVTMADETADTVISKTREESVQPARDAAQTRDISVTTTYTNPAGEDQIRFILMVDDTGVILDAKTEILATHDVSKKRQMAFAEGLPAVVNGKKLSQLTGIDRVGASSLTTQAFNSSINQLKSQL